MTQTTGMAPIALFVYKRLSHLVRTVEALKVDPLAIQTKLIIFSDGARNEYDSSDVAAVRNYLATISGFAEIEINLHDENLGLAENIIFGVSAVCSKYGRVIVLEDDIIVSPHFLSYMNSGLEAFKDDDQVMHISAASYLNLDNVEADTYFLRIPLCWGWGTWEKSWRHFRREPNVLGALTSRQINEINFNGSYNFWRQAEDNISGDIKTWFIYWYAIIILMNGLCLFPSKSLVQNIGFDGTGENSRANNKVSINATDFQPMVRYSPSKLTISIYWKHVTHFRRLKPSLFRRLLKRLRRILKYATIS